MFPGDNRVSLRWFMALAALLALILIPFFLFATATEEFAERVLSNTNSLWLLGGAVVALLALDVFLPIPSSLVSTLAGGLFGFTIGTLVSFLGLTASCIIGWLFGFYIGTPSADAMLGKREYDRLRHFYQRYGMLAIAICRAVPVAAEASVIVAGAAGAGFFRTIVIAALSNLGISLVYAAVGAYAWTQQSFLVAFLGAIAGPLTAFLIYRLLAGRIIGESPKRS